MNRTETKLDTYKVNMICECGGILEYDNLMYPTYPPQYKHRCNKCSFTKKLDKIYPCIEYKAKGDK